MKKKTFLIIVLALVLGIVLYLLYYFNIIPHKKYTNADFKIETYESKIDKDSDGIDDQTDILESVKAYLDTKPKYKSKYYGTGYPDDNYGVCTDVVVFGFLGAGYDLRELVNVDVKNNREDYNIDVIDKNIDFRRVNNLNTYFKHTAISLTLDIKEISEWQGGDVVVFKNHIGIISEHRNKGGIPFVYHHASPRQVSYEEDVLEHYEIIGHYRVS